MAPAAHQPHLVRWVREFQLFAQTRRGYSFEQTLDLFLAEVGIYTHIVRELKTKAHSPLDDL